MIQQIIVMTYKTDYYIVLLDVFNIKVNIQDTVLYQLSEFYGVPVTHWPVTSDAK